MSFVVDIVTDVFDLAVDIVADVGGALVGAVKWVVDDVIQPVVKTVGNVIEAALDDPLKTIAQIAAVATGNAWMLPLIEGADVAISGGDLGDVLESAAKAYVMQQVGTYAGKAAGSYAGNAASEAGWSAANQKIAAQVLGSAAGSGAVAVVAGRDPLQAFLSGGVSAGTSAVLGKISNFGNFANDNKVAANVISSAVLAQLSGGNVSASMIGSLIASSGLVADAIRAFDPENGTPNAKLDAAQTAILTDVLMGTASAALSGGDPSRVVQAALMKAGSKALAEMATDAFKAATTKTTSSYSDAQAKANVLDANIAKQQEAAGNYNEYASQLQVKIDEQNRLRSVYDNAVAAHNANPTEASRNTANAAAAAFDTYVTQLNKDYAETFSPNIKKYGDQLDSLKADYAIATGDYEAAMQAFASNTDTLSGTLDSIYLTSNRAFTEALDPNFNADQYRKINKLGADVDVYEHYLQRGQLEGLATNDKDQAIIEARNQVKEATGQDIPNYIIERALTVDNANRDTVIKQYADTKIQDSAKLETTVGNSSNAVLDAYKQAGYTQDQINAKIDSGEAGNRVDELLANQKANVESLRQYATDLGASAGTDSAEYKEAAKNAANAMADYGGYGITKTGETFTSAQYGELDPDRLLPVTKTNADDKSGWYIHPVTGETYIRVYVYGIGGNQEYLPASEIPEQEISALWAIGESANPPESGGGSYFGSGSGVSSGMFGGLQLVSIDDATGAKMYSDGSGMTLIAYSDGKGKVINNKMEVELITPEELAKLMGEVPEVKPPTPADQVKDIADIVKPVEYDKAKQDALTSVQDDLKNSYQTSDEVKEALESLGYKATPEEIQSFVGEKTPDQLRFDVEKYIDPLMVSREEVKAAYAEMGLAKPTDADIEKLIGQYAQTDLQEKAAANLDVARFNSLQAQLDTINQAPIDVASMRESLEQAIQAAKDVGLEGDAALQAAISAVAASQKTSSAELLAKLGTTETALKTEFASGLAGVTQSVADTKTALEAAIADAKATGLTGDAALQKAIDSVAADAQVSKEELLSKLGTTEAALKADFEAGLSGVSSDIAATRSALEIAVRTAIDIGLQGDAAIQAAIDSVAADQQISKQELLAQLGTTETNLRAVMAAGISGVEQQLKDQYASMTAAQKSLANDLVSQGKTFQEAMDAAAKSTAEQIAGVSDDLQKAIDINEAAGMSRDAAISKAVDDVAASVGSTRADLLAQLGATEQSLLDKFQAGQEQTQEQIAGLSQEMQQQYAAMTAAQKAEVESRIQQGQSLENALGTVQQALEAQVTDVESRLSAAIAEAEAMGLSRDQAITAAVNAVASDLNTSREELLSQIGQTEQSLKTQIESGLSGLSGEMQAQYESLTEAQKATADALVAQGETFQNALAAAQAETTGQIEGLTAEMQAQYAALTDAQKATANALVAQGETFQNALTTAQAETTSLINTKTDAINTRIAELVAQGVTQQAATTQAFAEVNAKLGSQGRGPDQSDLDALEAMISGSRPTDLSYDVNNDGRIDSSDLSFLTGIVNQTEGGSGFTAPAGSPWAATGLYGELADAEAARAQDAENQRLAGEAAAAQAATNARNAQLRGVAGSAAQSLQQFAGTAPTLMRQATEQVSDPIYGQGIRPFDFGSPLDVGWFSQSKEKQGSQKGTQTTKMAAGGYLDDLLAEDMSVDDLLKLLS